MNLFITAIFSAFIAYPSVASAFEIKPFCVSEGGGAYCDTSNSEQIHYEKTSMDCLKIKSYILGGKNKPIHEAITRQAYKKAFNKPLKTLNFRDALISGVEWNDDPEQLARKIYYSKAFKKLYEYVDILDTKPKHRLTVKSHYGNMQFLHAMRPTDKEHSSSDEIRQLIYDWIKYSYKVALGDLRHDLLIEGSYFNSYMPSTWRYKKIADIFDPRKLLRSDDQASTARAVQRLASGNILHIIQDSYSTSHTHRSDDTNQLLDFYSYPNDKHCLQDAAHYENKESINHSINASVEYMLLVDQKSSWCEKVAPFIKRTFNAQKIVDNECSNILTKIESKILTN